MSTERRRKQVAQRVRERLGYLFLRELKDPRAGFLTITNVEMNADLTVARVRYTVLGGEKERKKTERMLAHAHGFLRTEVAHHLGLRTAPQLVFEYDEGLERASRIEEILHEVLPPEVEGGGDGGGEEPGSGVE